METSLTQWEQETKKIIASESKLRAVMYLRRESGLSLTDCKQVIDKWATEPNEEDLLTVAAVNACKEINPANPLKIAEMLPKMLDALKEGLDQLESWNQESEPSFTMRRIKEILNKLTNTHN